MDGVSMSGGGPTVGLVTRRLTELESAGPNKWRLVSGDRILEDAELLPASGAALTAVVHESGIFCVECQSWLNGTTQWRDHLIGKKHRKNVQRARAQQPLAG